VFDVAGRLVRVLVDGEAAEQGRHESIWNGRDDAGRRVVSGTCFYRLEAGEYSETKMMVLVK
jgi:flagellar hook assembly protein FlgD